MPDGFEPITLGHNPSLKPRYCPICNQQARRDVTCDEGWIETPPLAEGYASAFGRCVQWQAKMDGDKLSATLGASNLVESQYTQNWEELELKHESWKLAKAMSGKIDEIVSQGLNLVFLGGVGTGKTLASVLLCREAVKLGYNSLKVDWSKFLDTIRDSYSDKKMEPENQQFFRLESCDLLLLDDIGSGEKDESRFSQSRLEKVISRRYDQKKPTIVTANFNPQQIEEVLGVRSASRIQGRMIQVKFSGTSYRVKKERESVNSLINNLWLEAKL